MKPRAPLMLATASIVCIAIAVLAAQDIRLRIGTVVPRGSLWHDTLQYIAQDWQRIVGPGLKVVIHPDSQLGDEMDMVRKARGGIIEAVGLSSVGLSRIDNSVSCLQVPMMLESVRGARLRARAHRAGPGAPHRVARVQGAPLGRWRLGLRVLEAERTDAR